MEIKFEGMPENLLTWYINTLTTNLLGGIYRKGCLSGILVVVFACREALSLTLLALAELIVFAFVDVFSSLFETPQETRNESF